HAQQIVAVCTVHREHVIVAREVGRRELAPDARQRDTARPAHRTRPPGPRGAHRPPPPPPPPAGPADRPRASRRCPRCPRRSICPGLLRRRGGASPPRPWASGRCYRDRRSRREPRPLVLPRPAAGASEVRRQDDEPPEPP